MKNTTNHQSVSSLIKECRQLRARVKDLNLERAALTSEVRARISEIKDSRKSLEDGLAAWTTVWENCRKPL